MNDLTKSEVAQAVEPGDVTVQEQLDAARAELAALNVANESLAAEISGLTAERDKLAEAVTKAAAAPKASRGAAIKGRKVGPVTPIEGVADADGNWTSPAAVLLGMIRDAGTVEVVFSNGKTEIGAIAPVMVVGDAWVLTAAGLTLRLPELIVHGPGQGQAGFTIVGYGLFLDGRLTAYRTRSDPLTVAAGARLDLSQDVVF